MSNAYITSQIPNPKTLNNDYMAMRKYYRAVGGFGAVIGFCYMVF